MRISDKTVLVTGAGGFIGSHLLESLVNQGSRVKALIHYNSMNNWGHLENTEGEVVNIGSSVGVTIEDIVLEIQKQLNKNLNILHDNNRDRPEKSEVTELICDNKKAKEMLNWKSQYSLSDGIKNTIEYIRENQNLYKNNLYTI